MKHYYVVSPSYVVYPFDGINPPEDGCDVVAVEASNKREAKSLALRTEEMSQWILEARDNHQNPFSGLEVYEAHCPHGTCMCGCQTTEDGENCPLCEAEVEND